MLVGGEAFGGGEPDEFDAFLLGVRNLALRPRHILAVAAIEALHRLRALTHRGADAVHRGIAAADYDDMLVLGIEAAIVERGNVVAKALAVRRDQIVERRDRKSTRLNSSH